jgi:hypothetical protein
MAGEQKAWQDTGELTNASRLPIKSCECREVALYGNTLGSVENLANVYSRISDYTQIVA